MNKFRTYRALARSVILESIRRKDLWVLAILGVVILLGSGAIGFFGFTGLESFAKDLATTVLGAFSTVLAVLTSSRLIPDEIKNRTIYPLISRPITRFDLLLGKLIGAVVVSWISFLLLCAMTVGVLALFKVPFDATMLQYVFVKMMGLVVVCSFTLLLSLLMTSSAATTLSFVLLFGSGMIVQALVMAAEQVDPATQVAFRVVNAVLPQVALFDLGGRVANSGWGPVPVWVLGTLFCYMAAYSAATMGLGWAKFRKKAI